MSEESATRAPARWVVIPTALTRWVSDGNGTRTIALGIDICEGVHETPEWYAEAFDDGESIEVAYGDAIDEAVEELLESMWLDHLEPPAEDPEVIQ